MSKTFTTKNSKQTQKLGEILAGEIRGGEVICLSGDLGAGKTTFTQGFLQGLGVKGPYVSPTFLIMKQYRATHNLKRGTKKKDTLHASCSTFHVYHIDAYRVNAGDILDLGWEEIVSNPRNVVIIEWADRIKDIIPKRAVWIGFEWKGEEERKIIFKNF